jgi:hypothetical protein
MKRKEENNSIKKHCSGNTCALARKATSIVFVRHKETKRGKEGEGLLKTFKWAYTYAVHSIDLAIKSLGRYRVVSMQ